MNKKLITLTPMGCYYFGGEQSFSMGENDQNEFASYIVESNLFPQQTSLLGMLRFWILRNNSEIFSVKENKIINTEKAKSLIGANSFSADIKQDFKKISNIGSCFLQKQEGSNWTTILPAPLDYQLSIDFGDTKAYYNGIEKTLPKIHYSEKKDDNEKPIPHTAKEGLIKRYISLNNDRIFEESDIFIKDQRIGINRNIETGLTEANALYKQIFYRLADGFRFAFVADFNNEALPPNGQIVELGGDSSKFILNYESWDNKPDIAFDLEGATTLIGDSISKITLLSDTLLDNKVVEDNTIFSITEHIPFRFLTFDVEETNYSRKSSPNKNKQSRFSLFKRGSVFFFKDNAKCKKFEEAVNNEIFTKIGYNNYQPKTINNHEKY